MVAIYDRTSCDEPGTAYYNMDTMMENPWAVDSSSNTYATYTGNRKTDSAFTFCNGYSDADDYIGKVFVIYDTTSTMIGCGVLEEKLTTHYLIAQMSPYPEYAGDLMVSGSVYVAFHRDDTFIMSFDLKGLEADVENAGLHIHTGTSCDEVSGVLGHYWDDEIVNDLWTAKGGLIYSTEKKGKSKGSFHLYNGYGIEENVNHAVVIHASDGSRISCGVLNYM